MGLKRRDSMRKVEVKIVKMLESLGSGLRKSRNLSNSNMLVSRIVDLQLWSLAATLE